MTHTGLFSSSDLESALTANVHQNKKCVSSCQLEQGEHSHPTETMMWRIPAD